MRDQVLKLEARWKTGAKEPYKLTAKTILEAMQLRSNHEVADFTLKKARAAMNLVKRQFKHVGVVTDLSDLRVKIDLVHVRTKQPYAETATQTEQNTEN